MSSEVNLPKPMQAWPERRKIVCPECGSGADNLPFGDGFLPESCKNCGAKLDKKKVLRG